jgi:hypothetical protein
MLHRRHDLTSGSGIGAGAHELSLDFAAILMPPGAFASVGGADAAVGRRRAAADNLIGNLLAEGLVEEIQARGSLAGLAP